ncbi:MAG: 1,4-alpha-glucan branching protein GlgB [Chloroflexi bacterium]|jgi:1,4-alpha-glucan branching enzyme|nr:1,4-alpha-glucan branching protein GlgB [Chloroflexota bacterium]
MNYPTIPYEEIDAIVGGYHGDPFSILGPHKYEDGVIVRAFLPLAEDAEVMISSRDLFAMEKVKADGFFEVFLPQRNLPFAYLLKTKIYTGETVLYEDPYAFPSTLSDFDAHLLSEGTHMHMYEKLGAHLIELNGSAGVLFAVWAPNALRVSVVGEFNQWDGRRHTMRFHSNNGIWEIFIPGIGEGILYKYEIKTRFQGYMTTKADPVGFFSEMRPKNASIVWDIDKYEWQDKAWMETRAKRQAADAPISIYEVHLGSWRRKDGWEWLTYEDLARDLIPYIQHMGYTHIELLPITEHPFDGSWGYQVTGFFAPTSRFGTPDQFMAFVDACHQAGIGVILDWVPAHYPKDEIGLGFFDGTHLYEHADPRQGAHPDWGTYIFNYARNEVSQFLVSNALFWLDKYHIDGLRVDAVASMLYLDFSREPGQWIPNRYGGRENLAAIEFIRRFNTAVTESFPGVVTIAEESTSWPGVSQPVSEGGLGFDYKWNMGWMHDTLQYMENDPIYRAYHHGTLTFSLLYAFSEQFILPFSHDEVVHLKKSMLDKMPGDLWQKFANLRLLFGYKWSHPGKKLQFMGSEFGQWREWNEAQSLDWHLIEQDDRHRGLQDLVRDLNQLYTSEPALYEIDYSWEGFFWVDLHDSQNSVLAYGRRTATDGDTILIVCNFTPVVRPGYRLGVPQEGTYVEILNTDAAEYGGSNVVNTTRETSPTRWHDQPHSIQITLPPLGAVYWKLQSEE